ncbi:MAG: radical SAM protein [Magnetococcales bacterium]|nr:radical SAM protein [Magnetococcales bacterium]
MGLFRQRARLYTRIVMADRLGLVQPVVTAFFITTRCNAHCNYCYTDKGIAKRDEMTTRQICDTVDGLVGMGTRIINLMGGEPLLRDDFPEILRHIRARNIVCDVNTNCFLIEKHLDLLRTHATQLFTSLDGDEQAHDLNRGAGTFNKTVHGIRLARQAGIPVRINCTVTRHNADKIDFLIDFSERYNLFLTFTPLVRAHTGTLASTAALTPDDQEAKNIFQRIKAAKARSTRIMNSDAALDYYIHYPVPFGTIVGRDETGLHRNYYTRTCPYGRLQFFVTSNGNVYSCHNMWNEPTYQPGNVLRQGVRDAIMQAHAGLTCKYCWLANLVEWNEFTTLPWLFKGIRMTLRQMFERSQPGSGI